MPPADDVFISIKKSGAEGNKVEGYDPGCQLEDKD